VASAAYIARVLEVYPIFTTVIRLMLAGASLNLMFASITAAAASNDTPLWRSPNLLVVQCDDLGWDDLGVNGNPYVATPRLDMLARQSVRSAQFTVNPVCAPSRATLLTGRHFLRTGVSHVHGGKDFLHRGERTLADHLQAAGYATGMWGKWHLGRGTGYDPWDRGFQEAYAAQLYRHRATRGEFNGQLVDHAAWADTAIADYAIDFITRHRNQPWFAYVATMTPHGPLDAPDHYVQPLIDQGLSPNLARLWGMVGLLDAEVGRILDAMDALGVANDTIVVFLSDNGPAIEQAALSDADRALRKISGMRGWKGDLYQNGVHSPLFVRWPQVLTPHEIAVPLDHVGLLPTLLDLMGVPVLADAPPLDGQSFAARLRIEDPAAGRGGSSKPVAGRLADASPLVFNYAHRGWLTSGPPYSLDGLPGEYLPIEPGLRGQLPITRQTLSVRDGRFKLIVNPEYVVDAADGSQLALFDLVDDPSEQHDLASALPGVRARLWAELNAWWATIQQDPHAFAVPVHSVGAIRTAAGGGHSPAQSPNLAGGQLSPVEVRIAANAIAAVSGATYNMVTGVKGWHAAGDGVDYALSVQRVGAVHLELVWNPVPPLDWVFEVLVDGVAVGVIDSGQPRIRLELAAGECRLGVRLSGGTPTGGDVQLRRLVLEHQP
jgi:arylsulfatase A-like enzyme